MNIKIITASLVLFLASSANASIFRLDMNGSVIWTGSGVPAGAPIARNDAVSLSVVFDDSVAANNVGSTTANFYDSIISFDGSYGSYAFSGDNSSVRLGNGNATRNGVTGDTIKLALQGVALNSASGINRNDFISTDGSVGGQILRSVEFDVFNENTNFINSGDSISVALNALVADFSTLTANDPFADNVGLRISFSDQAWGSFPVAATADISSLTLTQVSAVPVPAAVWLFGSGLAGLAGFARRKV